MKIIIMHATTKPRRKPEEKKADNKTLVKNEIDKTLGKIRMTLPDSVSGMVQAFANRVMSEDFEPLTFEMSASAVDGVKPYFSVFTNKPFSQLSLEDKGGIVPDITVENLQDMFIKVCEKDLNNKLREEGIEC
jgi:hypothetical protein